MKMRCGLIALSILAALPCVAQTLTIYDDFHGKLINPAKWNSFCFSDGPEEECVRQIQNESLQLAHRVFGLTNSNVGQQNGGAQAELLLPGTVKTIKTDLVVRSILEVPCATNSTFGTSAGIITTFFNAGSGDATDDVGAQFGVTRFTSDPSGQLTVRGQIFHGDLFFDFVVIGTISIGTPMTINLTWDQSHHQFVISFTNKITGQTTVGTMPYTFSDTTPAVGPFKNLLANGWAANCTANQTFNYVDALFSNVFVGR